MLMLAGLFAAPGCEQKPAEPMSGKITFKDVHRDAGQIAKPAVEHPQQTKEEPPKTLEVQRIDQAPEKDTSRDVRRDTNEDVKAVSESAKQDKAVFQKKLEAQLDKLDIKIGQLRAKGSNLAAAAKENWEQRMAELDVKRDAARAKLDKVVHASAEAWNDVQNAAESAYDDLDGAIRNAWRAF
jgi:hypothetical protein